MKNKKADKFRVFWRKNIRFCSKIAISQMDAVYLLFCNFFVLSMIYISALLTVLFREWKQTNDIPTYSLQLDGGDSEALSQGSHLEYFIFKNIENEENGEPCFQKRFPFTGI